MSDPNPIPDTVKELDTTWVPCSTCDGYGHDPKNPNMLCPECLGYGGAYVIND